MADWDKFDYAFTCPSSVKDEDLRLGFEKALAELRRECAGSGMSTAMILRSSVMLGWHIKHMQTSRAPYKDDQGYQHPGQEKDAVLALTSVMKDHDDIRLRTRAKSGLAPEQVRDVFLDVLAEVDDPRLRALLQDKLADALAAV